MRLQPDFIRQVHTRLGEMIRSAERLRDSDLSGEQRRQVEIIRAGADWLLAAMDDVPRPSQPAAGNPHGRPAAGGADSDHADILAVLRESFDDDHDAKSELLEIFIAGAREYHARLVRAKAENDREELKRVVHTLKGSAASVGSGRITTLAAFIGKRVADDGDLDGLTPLLAALEAQIESLKTIRIPAG